MKSEGKIRHILFTVLSTLLVMCGCIRVNAAFTADEDFINKNLRGLQAYIDEYGGVNSDGDHILTAEEYDDDGNVSNYGIVSEYGKLTIVSTQETMMDDGDISRDATTVILHIPSKPTESVQVIVLIGYDFTYKVATTLNIQNFTFEKDYRFSLVSTSDYSAAAYLDSSIQKLSNTLLDLALLRANKLTMQAGYPLLSLGFTSLCTEHNFTKKVLTQATTESTGREKVYCTKCGIYEIRTLPQLPQPDPETKKKVVLNAYSVVLQRRQKNKAVTVQKMASDEKIQTINSSNKSIVTGRAYGRSNVMLIAGRKTGTAYVTITLSSGRKAVLKVRVQTGKVRTSKINISIKNKITIRRGQNVKIGASLLPITSQDTLKYSTSNKKIATVTSTGTIKGVRRGSAIITVRAGSKKVQIKVTVR